jgi:Protein of unknown function (DUF2812).
MKKVKFFLDFDKEESWLNQMADDGFLLTKAGLAYRFSVIEPKSAVVKVDYRPAMSETDFADYLSLFSDAGWQHQAGSRQGGPQYFASFSGDANAEIFSDADSRAQRYRRSIATYGLLLLPFVVLLFVLWTQGNLFPAPGDWYLTPGLWDKQGPEFVGAFLFETPFVLVRVIGPLLLIAFCVYLMAVVAYQWNRYRQATN